MNEGRKELLEKKSKKKMEYKRSRNNMPNRKSEHETVDEELQEREDVIEKKIQFVRQVLPNVLKSLSQIPDPRDIRKVKHALSTLMAYGIVIFLFQMTSRREANREITTPIMLENLQTIIPEFKTMPHADTLARLVERIDVEKIRDEAGNIISRFIRNKKFKRLLVEKVYTIAIDGTGKFSRDKRWADECLEKNIKKSKTDDVNEEKKKYYVYVVEACFTFQGGIVLPFESEFLEYSPEITGAKKKDCEMNGFKRLVERICKKFPKLKIVIVADGLFATGPAMALLREKKWEFMIALKDDSLKSVWSKFFENLKIEKNINTTNMKWHDREQIFYWSNEIEYKYEDDEGVKNLEINVVVCEESWEHTNAQGEKEQKFIRFAWISSIPITTKNVHNRCNLIARARWGIESNILVEKHYGYSYEHCFSYNWNAMKGYHYLMHIAHIINELMLNTEYFYVKAHNKTMRGLIRFIKDVLKASTIYVDKIKRVFDKKHQLRFVF